MKRLAWNNCPRKNRRVMPFREKIKKTLDGRAGGCYTFQAVFENHSKMKANTIEYGEVSKWS